MKVNPVELEAVVLDLLTAPRILRFLERLGVPSSLLELADSHVDNRYHVEFPLVVLMFVVPASA